MLHSIRAVTSMTKKVCLPFQADNCVLSMCDWSESDHDRFLFRVEHKLSFRFGSISLSFVFPILLAQVLPNRINVHIWIFGFYVWPTQKWNQAIWYGCLCKTHSLPKSTNMIRDPCHRLLEVLFHPQNHEFFVGWPFYFFFYCFTNKRKQL